MAHSLPQFAAPAPVSAEIKSVCVFCGAGDGADPIYAQQGYELGKLLAQNNIRVVYGGGSIGIMGAVAKGALENGGKVLGIVPEPLYRHGSKQISEIVIVPDMHTRKKRMADESDGFICLPGGFGTMEEMLEMITWSQLNIHSKPILLLNTKGYYNLFVEWIKVSVQEQFIKSANANIFVNCDTTEELLQVLKSYKAPETRYGLDWTKKDEERRQSLYGMGVLGLTGILKKYAPSAVQTVSASIFARQTIAIDASCHLNKFVYGDEQVPHRHIYGFYQLARFCDLNRITPIFVFDGPRRLEAKQMEHAKRARTRRKVKHSLVFEKEQASRLDAWLEVTDALMCQQELFPEEDAFKILNDEKILNVAQQLLTAIETAQDKDKYTRTVRELAMREGGVVTELDSDQLNQVKSSLQQLRQDNQHMLNSLEKRSYRITQKMRTECQEFLTTLGYICFSCDNHEAEAMCANLSKHGRTTATVSEDLDTLAFGDAPILRYFFSRGRPILSIDPIVARHGLGLSRDSFIDLCILCGTDFSGTIQGIGPHRALKWIQKYGSIENILENLHDTPYKPQDTFDYQLARHVFGDLPPIPTQDSDYESPQTTQSQIDDIIKYYEIDPTEVDLKLKTTLLTQNVIDSNQWGSDPFATKTKGTLSIEEDNKDEDGGKLSSLLS